MEVFFLYLLLVALAVYAIRWMRSSAPVGLVNPQIEVTPEHDSPAAVYRAHEDLLQERWRMAGVGPHATRELELPTWYYADAEDWQVERLVRDTVPVEPEELSCGQAHDVIGLSLAPGEDEIETLRAFGEPVAGLNRTVARHRAAKLIAIPERRREWEQLPPLPLQREYFRFIGQPIPVGATAGAVRREMAGRLAEDEALARDWARFLQVYDDVNARHADYGIRPVAPARLGAAVDALRRSQGRTLAQLARNLDLVVEKLTELDPELELE
jgi:hypothetical protein